MARYSRDVGERDFTHPTYQVIWKAVATLGGPEAAADAEVWVGKLRDALESGPVPGSPTPGQVFNALAVEPPCSSGDPSPSYVAANVFRLQELPLPAVSPTSSPGSSGPTRRPRSTTGCSAAYALENQRRAARPGDGRGRLMGLLRRGPGLPDHVTRAVSGRVLASADADDGTWLVATRDALWAVGDDR